MSAACFCAKHGLCHSVDNDQNGVLECSSLSELIADGLWRIAVMKDSCDRAISHTLSAL